MRPVNVFKVGANTSNILKPGWYAGVAQPDMGPYATEQEAWASIIEYATRQQNVARQPENSYVVHFDPANPPPPTVTSGELSRLNETP